MLRVLSLATLTLLLGAPPAAAAPPKKAAAKPVAASAPSPAPAPARGGDLKNLAISGWLDAEFGDLDGIGLRADASLPLMALTPQIQLLGVGSIGFTHLGDSASGFDVSWNMFKVLAWGRAQMAAAPAIDVFADLGLGFYFGGWKSEYPFFNPVTMSWGTASADGTDGGFTMRLAVGGHYRIDRRLQVSAEMGLNPYFGEGKTTNFFLGLGAQYSL